MTISLSPNPEAYEAFELAVSAFDLKNEQIADELYRALSNNVWYSESYGAVSFSMRSAGELVARMRDRNECYLDYYSSGGEGIISIRITEMLGEREWFPNLLS